MSDSRITGRDPLTGRSMCVWVEAGTVARIEPSSDESEFYLSHGFVDLQVNGHSGFDVNDPLITPSTIIGLVKVMLSLGVTCFAPTIISAPEQCICTRLRVIADARGDYPRAAACIPFVHVEGPHISPSPAIEARTLRNTCALLRWKNSIVGKTQQTAWWG